MHPIPVLSRCAAALLLAGAVSTAWSATASPVPAPAAAESRQPRRPDRLDERPVSTAVLTPAERLQSLSVLMLLAARSRR